MVYEKFQPAAALRPYVMCYYMLEHSQYLHLPIELYSPPLGLGGMVFNYGDPYWIVDENNERTQAPPQFLAGQFKKNYTLRLRGEVGMIGIAFWPAALSHLLGIPMIEFTEQRIDLSLVLGLEADVLRQQLLVCKTHEQRIQMLEHFLAQKLVKAAPTTDLVDCAIQTIFQQKGIVSIRQLSDDLCISPRQFRRRFTEKVGIAPKLFARIKRFNYISQLSTTSFDTWMEMVDQGGYYDQSHFIRDFCDFSGRNPSEFVNYHRTLVELMES